MYPVIFELPDWFPFLGGQPITSFGVFMLLAFLTAGYVLRAELRRVGEDPEKAWDFVFMAVVGGILGAKGYYILLNWRDVPGLEGAVLRAGVLNVTDRGPSTDNADPGSWVDRLDSRRGRTFFLSTSVTW